MHCHISIRLSVSVRYTIGPHVLGPHSVHAAGTGLHVHLHSQIVRLPQDIQDMCHRCFSFGMAYFAAALVFYDCRTYYSSMMRRNATPDLHQELPARAWGRITWSRIRCTGHGRAAGAPRPWPALIDEASRLRYLSRVAPTRRR
eukprot:jgi/Ulvmu1/7426/UM036_0087.1